MLERPVVPNYSPPGPLPGFGIGVLVGLLLASIWRFGAVDVAVAVTSIFAALVLVLLAGSQGWRPFAAGLLVGSVVGAGLLVGIPWYGAHLGW